MCDQPSVNLRTIVHSLETRVPKIVLQRVEEVYPSLVESMERALRTVSVPYNVETAAWGGVTKVACSCRSVQCTSSGRQRWAEVICGETMTTLDDSLLSLEKLDRTSPELWPEQIPGVSEYVSLHPSTPNPPQPWTRCLDQDDINLLHQFGSLTASGLIAEVKKLHDVAYQLGLEEAKEMTRGKYLNILIRRRR